MKLVDLFKAYPELTFDNQGYDKLDSAVMLRNKEGVEKIEVLLKQCIVGFVRFQNFKPCKDGSIKVRYQVYYDEQRTFIGVAYTDLNDLSLAGF
jgi:hypothetical protein